MPVPSPSKGPVPSLSREPAPSLSRGACPEKASLGPLSHFRLEASEERLIRISRTPHRRLGIPAPPATKLDEMKQN